jgi:hypothetical protein
MTRVDLFSISFPAMIYSTPALRNSWRFMLPGLLVVFFVFSGSLNATQLVVERKGNPDRYSSDFGRAQSALFELTEAIQVEAVYAFMNGGGEDSETHIPAMATFSVIGPTAALQQEGGSPFIPLFHASESFILDPAGMASGKWQGLSSLKWNLAAGEYKITIEGGFVPFALGAAPSLIDNQPYDYMYEDFDGTWHQADAPFGLQIYGSPLSAVPEPATYGLMGSLALMLTVAIRRRRIGSVA